MASPFDLTITDELLSTTRAVRKRLDKERPVEREVLLDCIRLSQQAPTGSNNQSWRWVVVTDAAKRAALAALYKELASQYLELARSQIGDGDAQTHRVYDSAFYLVDHLADPIGGQLVAQAERFADGGAQGFGRGCRVKL